MKDHGFSDQDPQEQSEEFVPVAIRLKQSTIDKVAHIKDQCSLVNNADAVRLSVEVTLLVMNAIKGGAVILIRDDFSTDRLVIPQLEK
jgi:hypothetical protein